MSAFFERLPRAFVLAALVYFGLHAAGVTSGIVWTAVAAVVASSFLHILTGVAAPVSALAMLWGVLTWAGIAPTADVAAAKIDGLVGKAQAEVQIASSAGSLEDKLAQLKTACDHGALSPEECAGARARLLAAFTAKP